MDEHNKCLIAVREATPDNKPKLVYTSGVALESIKQIPVEQRKSSPQAIEKILSTIKLDTSDCVADDSVVSYNKLWWIAKSKTRLVTEYPRYYF